MEKSNVKAAVSIVGFVVFVVFGPVIVMAGIAWLLVLGVLATPGMTVRFVKRYIIGGIQPMPVGRG